MAPPNWANNEQLKFLRDYIPTFIDYAANNKQSKFWARLNEDWFSRWPELDVLIKDGKLPPEASTSNPDVLDDHGGENIRYKLTNEERELYGAAIQARKQKLQNWMRNHKRKASGTSKVSKTRVSTSSLGLLNPRKRQRIHQEQEVYHRLYKHKLEKLIKEALDKRLPELQEVSDSSDEDESDGNEDNLSKENATESSMTKMRTLRMRIRREVRSDAWENESEEVRRQVREEVLREKQEVTKINSEDSKVGLERSPESRELVISNLMAVLKDTCAEIYSLTGWSTIALTGGPNPALNDKISLQTVTFGKTAAGHSFNDSYPGFQNDFVQPYLGWLKKLYADPLRRSAATAPTITSDNAAGEGDSTEPDGCPASPPLTSSRLTPTATRPLNDQPGGVDLVHGSEYENPLEPPETHPVIPTPDFHLRSDNGGPSEPISWAFHRQASGDSLDMDLRSPPHGAFEEENSPPTPSPPAIIRNDQIDPTLLRLSLAVSTPQTDGSQRLADTEIDPTLSQSSLAMSTPPMDVNQTLVDRVASAAPPPVINATTAHSLTSFTAARPQFFSALLSGGSSAAAARTATTANASSTEATLTSPLMASASTKTLPTPPAASPQRGLASTIILTSLSPAPGSASTHDAAPHSLCSNPAAAALDSVTTLPNHSAVQNGRSRGRGWGQGGRGGCVKENTAGNASKSDTNAIADTNLMHPISAASRRRITAINKCVYPPDGAPVAPLGASHSTNLDGMYPCVTFQATPPAAVPKKRSWDVVSDADIVLGKRARKERVRQS